MAVNRARVHPRPDRRAPDNIIKRKLQAPPPINGEAEY